MITLSKVALAIISASKSVYGFCDLWNQTSGSDLQVVIPGQQLYPLSNSSFISNNTGSPVQSAMIYFQIEGSGAYLNNFGCPDPFGASITDGNLFCIASNITAEEFTSAASKLETELETSTPPGQHVFGYAVYTPEYNCPQLALGSYVFSLARSFKTDSAELSR